MAKLIGQTDLLLFVYIVKMFISNLQVNVLTVDKRHRIHYTEHNSVTIVGLSTSCSSLLLQYQLNWVAAE